jgi:hypothetical protein
MHNNIEVIVPYLILQCNLLVEYKFVGVIGLNLGGDALTSVLQLHAAGEFDFHGY